MVASVMADSLQCGLYRGLLPANLSPLAKISFTSLFTRMNDGPLFVHTGRVEADTFGVGGQTPVLMSHGCVFPPMRYPAVDGIGWGMVWLYAALPLMGVDEERTLREYGAIAAFFVGYGLPSLVAPDDRASV